MQWQNNEILYWLKLWTSIGKLAKQSTWMDRWVTLPWPEATHRFPVRLRFYNVLAFPIPKIDFLGKKSTSEMAPGQALVINLVTASNKCSFFPGLISGL